MILLPWIQHIWRKGRDRAFVVILKFASNGNMCIRSLRIKVMRDILIFFSFHHCHFCDQFTTVNTKIAFLLCFCSPSVHKFVEFLHSLPIICIFVKKALRNYGLRVLCIMPKGQKNETIKKAKRNKRMSKACFNSPNSLS